MHVNQSVMPGSHYIKADPPKRWSALLSESHRRKQGSIDRASTDESFGVDDEVSERIEIAHGVHVAHFGTLYAQGLGLAIHALAACALIIDGMVRTLFDTHTAVWIACGLLIFAEAVGQRNARVVVSFPFVKALAISPMRVGWEGNF
jgi:hypothetical protein